MGLQRCIIYICKTHTKCSQLEKLIQEMYIDNDEKIYNHELNKMETVVCDFYNFFKDKHYTALN